MAVKNPAEIAQYLQQTGNDETSFAESYRDVDGALQPSPDTILALYRGGERRQRAARALRSTVVNRGQLRRRSGPRFP